MNENITVLKDESLGGIEREYREVKRKANVGERIKVTADRSAMLGEDFKGTIHTVTSTDSSNAETDGKWADGSTLNPAHEDYVVLEPIDIVRIDSERLRMVDRKAAVGERVIVVNAQLSGGSYRAGDVLTAVEVRSTGGITIDKEGRDMVSALWRREYHVLEPVGPSVPLSAQPPLDQAAANISALTAKVQALESRVATLEMAKQPVKVAEGPADGAPPSFANMPRAKSLQQLRDEIVERAKADVKALETTRIDNVPLRNGWTATFNLCPGQDFVRFEINLNKRTVVALLLTRDGHVWARGIAKAAPNDVFNAHIGRAIALRRALGLEVPAEYLNVPNPEEPRVGDVVVGTISGIKAVVHRVGNGDSPGNRSGWVYGQYEDGDALSTPDFKIIDDSREEVGA